MRSSCNFGEFVSPNYQKMPSDLEITWHLCHDMDVHLKKLYYIGTGISIVKKS